MRIQHNIAALNSYRQLGTNNNAVSKNLEKLSSGYRINRAGDDAAGLAISEKMRAQITGLETAQKNAEDGISLVQTAEGALTEVHSMLNRMTELATQSANGTYSSEVDRENLQKEVATLKQEIDRISKSTNFNGIKLLDGSLGEAMGIDPGTLGGAAGINLDLGSGAITMSTFNEGKFIEGTNGTKAEASFYLPDEFRATSAGTGVGGQKTTTLEFSVGGATIKFTLTSGTNAGAVSTMNFSSAFAGLGSATNGTTTVTGGASNGGSWKLEITSGNSGSSDASVASFKDLNDNYTFTVADGRLTIQANDVGDKGTSGYEIGTTVTFSAADPNDKKEMTDSLMLDNGSGGGVDIEIGQSTGLFVAGEEKKPTKYELASAKFTIDNTASALQSYNNKIFEINGKKYILQDVQQRDSWLSTDQMTAAEQEAGVGPGGIEKIQFDSTKAGTEGMSLVGAIASKLNSDSTFKAKYDVKINSATELQITESVKYGNDVLAGAKPTDFNGFVDTSIGITIGKGASTSKITLGNDLRAGEWVQIGSKRYEFARRPEDVAPGSIFVQFKEGNAAMNAEALKEAIKDDFPGASVSGSDLNLGTTASNVSAGYSGISLQVGDTSDSYQKVKVAVGRMDTEALNIADVDISQVTGAEEAIGKLRDAINQVSSTRGDLGAVQNRLEHTINNLGVTTENITAAESRIRDTDMAEEMMAYTKNNILVQAAQAMLAQANTVPQGVLQLLG